MTKITMSGCYCANFYGSVNCRNTVPRFGDRCKLCVALKSGASLREGLLPDEGLSYMDSSRPSSYGKDSSRSSNGTTGRSSRAATFSKKH